jgi:hypothetical protein
MRRTSGENEPVGACSIYLPEDQRVQPFVLPKKMTMRRKKRRDDEPAPRTRLPKENSGGISTPSSSPSTNAGDTGHDNWRPALNDSSKTVTEAVRVRSLLRTDRKVGSLDKHCCPTTASRTSPEKADPVGLASFRNQTIGGANKDVVQGWH